MTINDSLRRHGDLLFRWRSYLPLAFLPLLLLTLPGSDWIEDRFGDRVDDVYGVSCILVSAAGALIRFAVAGHAPRLTSGRNTGEQVAEVLNVTGLYSVVRHPLYVGNFFMFIGVCLAPGDLLFALLAATAFALYYERIICAEEAFLAAKFGRTFEQWAGRVPTFLPDVRSWVRPDLPFCWRTAVRREYQAIMAMVCCFVVLDYLEDILATSTFEWETETNVAFAVTLVSYVAVRLVRKRTRWLHVAGR